MQPPPIVNLELWADAGLRVLRAGGQVPPHWSAWLLEGDRYCWDLSPQAGGLDAAAWQAWAAELGPAASSRSLRLDPWLADGPVWVTLEALPLPLSGEPGLRLRLALPASVGFGGAAEADPLAALSAPSPWPPAVALSAHLLAARCLPDGTLLAANLALRRLLTAQGVRELRPGLRVSEWLAAADAPAWQAFLTAPEWPQPQELRLGSDTLWAELHPAPVAGERWLLAWLISDRLHLLQQLQAQTQRQQRLSAHSPGFTLLLDSKGYILQASEGLAAWLGSPAATLAGQPLRHFLPRPPDRAALRHWAAICQSHRVLTGTWRLHFPQRGARVWAYTAQNRLADPVLRAVVLHLADITDLADAQAQSALLSQALAHAPIGLAVLGWQAPLRPAIRHANGAFYARLGLEPDSGPPEALWAHLPRAVAQALAVGLLHGQPIDLALTARGRLRGASDTLMDGAHEPAQTEWQCTPLPVWDDPTKPTSANGPQPEAWLLVVRDVSERERYQAQQAQQTRLRQHAALAAQEAERSRIARDLHDGAGQWLSLLSLQLQQLPDTPLRAEIQQTLSTLAQDVRHAVRNLSPANLTQMPLGDALRQLGAQVSAAGMSADWHLPEPEPQWPPSLAIDLFRMVQELVSNSLRHSQATEVRLHLRLDEVHGQLSLIYEDNGQGMHWPIRAKSVTNAGGQGLRNLAYRAQLLGGWLRIESAPGQGFAAWLSMPLGAPSQ